MIRFALILLCAAWFALPLPAAAQKPAAPAAPSVAAAITPDQAKVALDVLNDPAKRAAFATTLNAIIKGQAPADVAKPETPAVEGLPIPLAPDSLGAQVLVSASSFVNRLGNQAMSALDAVQSLPLLYGWAVVMVTNPVARDLLLDVSWRVTVALVCAVVIQFALGRLVRRPIRSLVGLAPAPRRDGDSTTTADDPDGDLDDAPDSQAPASQAPNSQAPDSQALARAEAGESEPPANEPRKPSAWTFLRRVPLVLGRLLLELVPVLGIALIGHLIAGSGIGGQTVSRLIILAVIDAYAMSAALLCVARMVLSPDASRLRLFHLSDDAAAYLMRWTRRLVVIAVVGYAVGEAWLLLGLSEVAHDLLQKTVGLVLHLCLAFIVIQKRAAVRQWLSAPEGATGTGARLRNRIGAVWHWVALFFLIAIWLVYAIEVPHGFTAVLHYFIVTAALLLGTRLTLLMLLGGIDRLTRPDGHGLRLDPPLDARLRIYLPMITGGLRLVIYVLCFLGLLQLYGLNTFIWLIRSELGQRILSSSGVLLTTLVLAFGIWEIANTGVQRHLDRLQRDAQIAKSARLRTLLPLLRSALLISIATVAGLTILSEIGINIAPLLAGAGILGVAIGFGSQKLVQDLITGIFLLLENAMQVGDAVTVSGLSGSVEALSVRTIRLRAGDGSVHIIPFSAVTTVTNNNRGLGNAAINVTVAYDEDTDRVAKELTDVVAGMRNDSALSAMMLSDLQLWGVDKVDGASVTIAGQVVCTDSGRWAVQREFNRRMKKRFQELGIRIYNPVQTITFSGAFAPPQAKELNDGQSISGPATDGHAQAAD